MEKKDNKIDQFLDNYLDQEINNDLLMPALSLLRAKKKKHRITRFIFVSIASSLAALMLFLIGSGAVITYNYFQTIKNGGTSNSLSEIITAKSYNFNTLCIKTVSKTYLIEKQINLPEELFTYDFTGLVFYSDVDNIDIMLQIKTRYNNQTSIDEIYLYILLTNNKIKELEKYESYMKMQYQNHQYTYYNFYDNGEYVTLSYFEINKTQYYLDHLSPNQSSGKQFITVFLNLLDKNS